MAKISAAAFLLLFSFATSVWAMPADKATDLARRKFLSITIQVFFTDRPF
jgi:hypothetical protein